MASPQAALLISKALASPARADRGTLWAGVLAEMPLFAGVPRRHLRRIAALTKEMRFAPGTSIVRLGEPGDSFYIVLEGKASVVLPGGGRGIALGPGDYFGEIALIDGAERTASVIAETEVFCLRLGTAPFLRMLRTEPEIAVVMLKQLAGRVRDAQARSHLAS
jgi:CRP-like cAMP-binding protein